MSFLDSSPELYVKSNSTFRSSQVTYSRGVHIIAKNNLTFLLGRRINCLKHDVARGELLVFPPKRSSPCMFSFPVDDIALNPVEQAYSLGFLLFHCPSLLPNPAISSFIISLGYNPSSPLSQVKSPVHTLEISHLLLSILL